MTELVIIKVCSQKRANEKNHNQQGNYNRYRKEATCRTMMKLARAKRDVIKVKARGTVMCRQGFMSRTGKKCRLRRDGLGGRDSGDIDTVKTPESLLMASA